MRGFMHSYSLSEQAFHRLPSQVPRHDNEKPRAKPCEESNSGRTHRLYVRATIFPELLASLLGNHDSVLFNNSDLTQFFILPTTGR